MEVTSWSLHAVLWELKVKLPKALIWAYPMILLFMPANMGLRLWSATRVARPCVRP